ncbi:MAG: hypothetical protein IPM79_05810 [Polyangiaceae bacterium]|nr:hypothetical protein [Polyangiaceae bacterium]MBK8937156.1 hypothetical protein [Polyangiaceae bacterium]
MSSPDFPAIVAAVNAALPVHSLWDGFWIHSYRRRTLIVSASFDRIYRRDFDLVFKQVTFFNLPVEWRDTNVRGDELLRLASRAELAAAQPQVQAGDRHIFAIDLHYASERETTTYTFFVLAKHVYLNRCEPADHNPVPLYLDPFDDRPFPCFADRAAATLRARRPGGEPG